MLSPSSLSNTRRFGIGIVRRQTVHSTDNDPHAIFLLFSVSTRVDIYFVHAHWSTERVRRCLFLFPFLGLYHFNITHVGNS